MATSLLAACSTGGSSTASAASSCNPADITVSPSGKVTSPPACNFKGQTLTVSADAGSYTDELTSSVGKLFEEATGANVQYVGVSDADAVSEMIASRGSTPPFDVNGEMTNVDVANALVGGGLEKLDKSKMPYVSALPGDAGSNPYYVGNYWYLLGMCYNTTKLASLGVKPDGLNTFFNPKLAGHVWMPAGGVASWELAMPDFALALGNTVDNPDPTVAKFATIKGLQLWEASSQMDTALENGSAWVGLGSDGRCYADEKAGAPLAFAPLNLDIDGKTYAYVGSYTGVAIPAGSPQLTLAEIYVNLSATEAAILKLAGQKLYTPTNQGALTALLSNPKSAQYVTKDALQSYIYNYSDFVPVLAKWVSAWNAAIK